MSKKKEKSINRRSFISDTGKTLLFGTIAAAAIPSFLEGCNKEGDCNILKEGDEGSHYCDTEYLCTDSRGFSCPAPGGFQCEVEGFSCYTIFSCSPESNFYCQPSSSFTDNVGGGGG